LKGGEVLNSFALTLIIGFIAGTYSTIFIASPLVLAWEKKAKK
ncbi:MAG: preprotein translocase subunit SecF, partial [Candidatus Omnitrophota bacterium]